MSQTHFGYQSVDESDKAARVRGVFDSVAQNYDVMNDLLSAGMHRLWKRYTVAVSGASEGDRVLDIAAGTGDLTRLFARKVGHSGQVIHTDINEAMLRVGRDRMIDEGVMAPPLVCDAEKLPFADNYFDVVCVAFGLRNMTHKDQALREMLRVLRPGGKLCVLEFSKVAPPLALRRKWAAVPDAAGFAAAGSAAAIALPVAVHAPAIVTEHNRVPLAAASAFAGFAPERISRTVLVPCAVAAAAASAFARVVEMVRAMGHPPFVSGFRLAPTRVWRARCRD